MQDYVFMEMQLPYSLIVTYQLYKNIFSSELNEQSAWNVIEIVLNFLEIIFFRSLWLVLKKNYFGRKTGPGLVIVASVEIFHSATSEQLAYPMFITINRFLFHFWWKENLVKSQNIISMVLN